MPTYKFKNKETGELLEQFLKIEELDNFLKDHPEFVMEVTGPAIIGTMGKNTPIPKKKV